MAEITRFARRRMELDMTQQQVADKAKVPYPTYQKLDNGTTDFKKAQVGTAVKIAEALSTTIDNLCNIGRKNIRMNVCLVVKVINKSNDLIAAYAKNVELPFMPTVGMKFKQGNSTWLWETKNGVEFPSVKEVVYNFDEETIYCLFEVSNKLESSFWTEITHLNNSIELSQFDKES